MNPLLKNLLRSAVGAALALGAAGSVRADAFAQSILVIDHFRLLHPNGTPYTGSDFAGLAGTSDTLVTSYLNGQLAGAAEWGEFGSAALDVTRRSDAGAPGSFGYGDARMDGAVITTTLGPAGALLQTRAEASLAAGGAAAGHAALASTASFRFALGADETMTIAFSAHPFARAAVSAGAGPFTGAGAAMTWSVSVRELATGATVFAFQPEQLNALGSVSRGDGFDGATIYAPGALSFAATTDMLSAGVFYQLTVAQSSSAGAFQARQIAEPATLAGFGSGLLAMAALARRRRRRAAAGNS